MRKCENANLRCECENAKKRSIDAMRCDHFEEFSECDANAKIDSHYQPWRAPFESSTGGRLVIVLPKFHGSQGGPLS
jgi:hypothetical protein